MGSKVKKTTLLLLMLLVSSLIVFAASITYVYGNNISSVDTESTFRRGQVFTDSSSNVLVLKRFYQKPEGPVAVFDKLISRASYQRGDALSPRGAVNSFGVMGSLSYALASWSMTTGLYPLQPLAMAGVTYGSDYGTGILALAGAKVNVPLARLWDARNTFIVNGKLSGWGAAGIWTGSSVTFACSFGFSYRHNVGSFNWEAGATWLSVPGREKTLSPYLGFGVDF